MKLKEYAAIIAKMAEKHPDALVIYASDTEVKSYKPVLFRPVFGQYNNGKCETPVETVNALCVN
jgi:hypothetical protein